MIIQDVYFFVMFCVRLTCVQRHESEVSHDITPGERVVQNTILLHASSACIYNIMQIKD